MFLYDVTRRETFTELMRIHGLVLRSRKIDKSPDGKYSSHIPMILLGNTANNNSDTDKREVPTEEGLEFAFNCKCPFYEISSKSHADVMNSFTQLLGEIVKVEIINQIRNKLPRDHRNNWRKSYMGVINHNDVLEKGKDREQQEELHESLKIRQKAFRYCFTYYPIKSTQVIV